jgi:hypothetical protein
MYLEFHAITVFVGTATKRSITHAFGMDKKGRIHIRTTVHHSTTMYVFSTIYKLHIYANTELTEMTMESVERKYERDIVFFPEPLGNEHAVYLHFVSVK